MLTYHIKKLYYPAALLIVCLLAYLPLSSFLFAPKNDAFIYNFPNKFFFSECIRNGYFPTWNPYLNFGFPLHADPGFAWWHPITWLFGLIGYNAYTFSIEILLYIYIGGLGMYWVGKILNLQRRTAFAMACMFLCNGFFIGNLQHINFLTGAAFIPWLTGSWLLFQKAPINKHLIYCGLSAYLLFTAGHPAIPIATVYFIACLTILYFLYFYKELKPSTFTINQAKLLGIFVIFLFPLIYTYVSIFPHYSRAETINQVESTQVGFTLPSYISFFFPFATIKNSDWFSTDVSMRNAYFSLLGSFGLLYFLFKKGQKKLPRLFLITAVFILFLSLGGSIKEVIYEHLPGLQLVRTNGEYRIFAIFCLIICAAYPINLLFTDERATRLAKRKFFTGIILVLMFLLLIFSVNTQIFPLFLGSISSKENIKLFLTQITFSQSFVIALVVAILLSILYRYNPKVTKTFNFLVIALIIDLVVNSWLLLPITGVGKTSVSTMQSLINKSPKGFPVPSLKKESTSPQALITPSEKQLIGNWAWYDKEIIHRLIDYPSNLKNTVKFLKSKDSILILNKPFLYLKNQDTKELNIVSFTPSSIIINAKLPENDTLILLQNNFEGWNIHINRKPAKHFVYSGTFMGVTLNKGTYNVAWQYSPPVIRILLIWSLLLTCTYIVHVAIKTWKYKAEI